MISPEDSFASMSSRVVALRERGKEAERKGEKKAGRKGKKKGGRRGEGEEGGKRAGGGRGINTHDYAAV